MSQLSVKISFGNLVVINSEEEPASLSSLDDNCHIHGDLQFCIGEKRVPYMGYWSNDDVCFSDWINKFEGIVKAFLGWNELPILSMREKRVNLRTYSKKKGKVFIYQLLILFCQVWKAIPNGKELSLAIAIFLNNT